jgi:probable HAF family extracellular repeat protein
MRFMSRTDATGIRAAWLLPCLLANLAVANAAGAGQTGTQTAAKADMYAAARTTYRVINLGAADLSELPAINNRGQVSFSLNTDLGSRGFFYDGTATVDIGTLGGSTTNAVDLNNVGQLTGYSSLPSGLEHAFVWRAGSGFVDLGTLPGAANSRAAAINNRGVVVGTSEGVPLTPPHAFRWSAADGIEDLGAFTSGLGSFSSATALNDAGLIAGNSDTSALSREAFVWTRAGGMSDISTPGSGDAYPVAVAARGQVVGHVVNPAGDFLYRAFLWTRARGMVVLGTAGGTESFVLAASPNEHVAGVINYGTGEQHAMSWTRAGGMRDLGTFGGPNSRALGVDSNGQIVGLADDASGDSRAFLWSAKQGMVDLNKRLRHAPAGLRLDGALAISDNGSIVATSNAGLVLLKPGHGREGTHSVGPVAAADLVKVGAPLDASVSFADADLVGTRGVTWSWGDGSSDQAAKVRESNGVGNASARHSYAAPGIYSVKATVVNAAGRSAAVSRKIIAYEPSGGVVGGSGVFVSPQGALRRAPIRSGKASFSFIAPLNMNAQAGGTMAQLHFDIAGLNFRSNNLRPMAAKGVGGQFEGSGAINGAGNYKFTLSTTAGATSGPGGRGRFGLKIWHTDPATQKEVVDYDNQGARTGVAGGPLVEGRILQE